MKPKFMRLLAGGAAIFVAASGAALLNASSAFANGTLSGPATFKTAGGAATLSSGNSDTTFTLSLPSGASCPQDSANGNYRWHTYMVPASVDPGTLTFGSGQTPPNGTGANFRQPLFTTTGTPVVNQQTANAAVAGGPGPIVNIPDMNHATLPVGSIPDGVYNIGIACTLGVPSPTQETNYWNVQATFKNDAVNGGSKQVDWVQGVVPNAPTLTTVTSGDTVCTVTAFTPGAAIAGNTPTTSYTATATPGGATATAAGAPIAITGLTNGTAYTITLHATNLAGNSAESVSLPCTPAPPSPTGVGAAAGGSQGSEVVTWTAPTGTAPTGYQVNLTGPSAGTQTPPNPVAAGTTSVTFTNLAAGNYSVTVTALHSPGVNSAPSSPPVTFTILSSQTLVQGITVVRPVGALVLTQVCGAYGALPADTSASIGFPSGSLPALTAVAPAAGAGAPTILSNPATVAPYHASDFGATTDQVFSGYPYPTLSDGTPNPTYPTYCAAPGVPGGTNLGNAQYIKSGPGAGQFFAASGRLNQVTVVDTRDTDIGWNIVGTMSRFVNTANSAKSFSGSELGWDPVKTSSTPQFTDSDGNSYTQVVNPGAQVEPNSSNATGLSGGKTLGTSPEPPPACTGGPAPTPTVCTGGLGTAVLDARLKLLIPVTAISGTYTAILTFSAI